MIRDIHLHGGLAEITGVKHIQLDVDSPRSLLSALRSQVPNFRTAISQHPSAHVVLASADRSKVEPLAPETFNFPINTAAQEIHLVPAIEGAGFDPLSVAIFISEALSISMTTAVFLTNIAVNFAVSMAIGFVSQALAPSPDTSAGGGRAEERPSFLYNGAINVVEQGYAIPVVYGTHMVGSTVVSAAVDVVELEYIPAQETPPANGGGSTQPAYPGIEDYQHQGGF